MIGLGFFDMVKAVFCAKDRDYTSVTKTFHSVDLVGWDRHRRHLLLLHKRCLVYRWGGGSALQCPDQRRDARVGQIHWEPSSSYGAKCRHFHLMKNMLAYRSSLCQYLLFIYTTCSVIVFFVDILFSMCTWCVNSPLTMLCCAVLPYWWDIYWYWSCATAAHSRVRTVVSSSTICKGILS